MAKFIDSKTLENKSTLPWIEKYRPEYIDQVVSHENTLRILKNMIVKNNFPHAVMYGPPGSGKTTTIKACAREMFGEHYSHLVLELNGSSERGIGIIRNQIDVFCQHDLYNNDTKRQKLVILDEADSMTIDAQSALRNVITTYTATTRFCLICNYITKIIEPLISRCVVFIFNPIPVGQHLAHLKNIVEFEGINIDEDTLLENIKLSKGDMRNSINVLQSLSMIYGDEQINTTMLYENIGQLVSHEMDTMIETLFNSELSFTSIINYLTHIEISQSLNITDIITIIVTYLIDNKTFDIVTTSKMLLEFEKIEYNVSIGSTTYIQLTAVAAIIKNRGNLGF